MRRPRLVRDGSRGSYRSSWNRRRNATRRLEASLEALTLFKVALTRRADRLAGGQIRRSRMWTVVSNPIFFQKRRPISFRACVYRSTSSTRRDRNQARASLTSDSPTPRFRPGRIDKQVVDVSVRSMLEDPRPREDRSQEEADRRPVELGDEAEAVPMPDVAACEAAPVSFPSGGEVILRPAKVGVVVLELLPHLREGIEIRDA